MSTAVGINIIEKKPINNNTKNGPTGLHTGTNTDLSGGQIWSERQISIGPGKANKNWAVIDSWADFQAPALLSNNLGEHILKPFKQFGRAPLVQQTAREKGVLGRISDLLMSNDEKVQELAVVTMDELQHDCTPNKQDFLDRGAIFMLCSIVQSRNRTIQESAINAMALAVECKNMNDLGIAEKAKEGIASSSGPELPIQVVHP